jgi:hypothetical protein
MNSPPSQKKLPIQDPTRKLTEVPVQVLEREEIFGVEEVHELLLESYVFVSIAQELDHDKRWPGRMTILMRAANDSVARALEKVEGLVRDIYGHRKRQSKKSR